MKSISTLFIASMSLIITACGGSSGDSNDTIAQPLSCDIVDQNRFVMDVMGDLYLYYDQLPNVDPSNYSSPEALLEDLKVFPDRFSYIANQQTQDDFFEEGIYVGLGYSYQNDDSAYILRYVFDDSTAGRAGLKRSDRILAIDGISVSDINANGGFDSFISTYNEGDTLIYSVSSDGNPAIDVALTIGLVKINTVISSDIITSNNLTVGYLALTSFLEPTKEELTTAFSAFSEANIDELVLDLRYNGGGRVTTAQRLSSLIAGDDALGADTSKLIYNDKNNDRNRVFPFESLSNAVNLKRLYVLTLDGTCSASELTINAMSPINIDVITIGQTTCGKPVGSIGIDFCGKTLNPISFDVFNDLDQGDYFDGIEAICSADDDLSNGLGNTNESMFATALSHMANGQCPVTRSEAFTSSVPSQRTVPPSFNIMKSVY
jgi:C-terminal processing protease CtpA/Prc